MILLFFSWTTECMATTRNANWCSSSLQDTCLSMFGVAGAGGGVLAGWLAGWLVGRTSVESGVQTLGCALYPLLPSAQRSSARAALAPQSDSSSPRPLPP